MLIPLICVQCGGKLEVEKSQVIEADDAVIVLDGQTCKCPHCGTQYLPGEKIKHFTKTPVISIGGSVVGSTIIVGNGLVVNRPAPASVEKEVDEKIEAPVEKEKLPKQWWQFWKE